MNPFPLRLKPGDDLRRAVEDACATHAPSGAFVIAGIGSLVDARLRFAAEGAVTLIEGPSEILTLAGSVASNGAHLHLSLATASGQVFGGHVGYGNRIRTTAELLVVVLADWALIREPDPATGYDELRFRRCQGGADREPGHR